MSGTAVAGKPARPSTPGEVLRALIVEDSSSDVELMVRELGLGGFEVSYNVAQSEAEFRALVRANSYAIVLADFSLPQWRGLEALRVLAEEELDTPLILVSGTVGDLSAVECIKQGVSDYILKDRLARLPAAVRGALEEQRLRQERKCAQDDLAQKAHELARSNQELEQFAYVASHDLQEPLRMVAAYTELLAERYQGKLDAQADKYIHYAVDGARRMQTLIQDLLAFSRVGRQEMALSMVNFENVVDLAIANLQTAIAENKAVIKREALPSLAAVQVFDGAGVSKPDQQRHQIPQQFDPVHRGKGGEIVGRVDVLGGGQRNWNGAGILRGNFRDFQAPAHAAGIQRQRDRAGVVPENYRAAGRKDLGNQRARQGIYFPFHAARGNDGLGGVRREHENSDGG